MTTPRSNSFVPLSNAPASATERQDFHLTLLPQTAVARPAQSASTTPMVPSTPGLCQPRIMLQREGQTITRIRIQCACGHVMELECEYEAKLAGAAESK